MVLSDKTILKRLPELVWTPKSDEGVIPYVLFKQINPNSLDLTISENIFLPERRTEPVIYGFKNEEDHERYQKEYWHEYKCPNGYVTLSPGHVILACTREYIRMPKDLCGEIFTKSTLGRMFINHMMAGVIDAGFEGRITLELHNPGIHTIRIPVGARIVQMILYTLDEIPEKSYAERSSRYMNAETVECAKWRDNND